MAPVAQRVHVLIGCTLTGKPACARIAIENMVIKSVHVLIASLLTPEFPDARIALDRGTPVITGIHMLVTGPLTGKGTGAGVALVHPGRARRVEVLLYENSG